MLSVFARRAKRLSTESETCSFPRVVNRVLGRAEPQNMEKKVTIMAHGNSGAIFHCYALAVASSVIGLNAAIPVVTGIRDGNFNPILKPSHVRAILNDDRQFIPNGTSWLDCSGNETVILKFTSVISEPSVLHTG
jgi:hypothetical protein